MMDLSNKRCYMCTLLDLDYKFLKKRRVGVCRKVLRLSIELVGNECGFPAHVLRSLVRCIPYTLRPTQHTS